MATKTGEKLELLRLCLFGEKLLSIWTDSTNEASFSVFNSNEGYLPEDCRHLSLFSSCAPDLLSLLNDYLAETFPRPSQATLKKACLCSLAALICQQTVRESVA
jgi:hypothetical protein